MIIWFQIFVTENDGLYLEIFRFIVKILQLLLSPGAAHCQPPLTGPRSSSSLSAMSPEAASLLSCLYKQFQNNRGHLYSEHQRGRIWLYGRKDLTLRSPGCLEELQDASVGTQEAEAEVSKVQDQPEINNIIPCPTQTK